MKLDINRITEIDNELKALELEDERICKEAVEKYGENWFEKVYSQIKEIDKKVEELKHERIIVKATNIEVGDGISMSPYTDWDAYTVIERKETPKGFVLTVQEDKAIRTDHNGMSESQDYRFERDTNGIIRTIKWNPRKQWFTGDYSRISLGRKAYYDYSF